MLLLDLIFKLKLDELKYRNFVERKEYIFFLFLNQL